VEKISELYSKIGTGDRAFDIKFWQSQDPEAIFEAASEMLIDFLLIRGKNADESRLQRTIETFHRS
jgi:hypothetical protein